MGDSSLGPCSSNFFSSAFGWVSDYLSAHAAVFHASYRISGRISSSLVEQLGKYYARDESRRIQRSESSTIWKLLREWTQARFSLQIRSEVPN